MPPNPPGAGQPGGHLSADDPRLWVRLKHELLRQIEAGVLEPGDEVAITYESRDFGVTPDTAMKAFRALVADGKLLPPSANGKPYTVP